MTENRDYERITEIASTDYQDKANNYLKLGWILLNIESNQYSEHGWSSRFVFGWPKAKEDICHPEKSEMEKAFESKPDDESLGF